jgi:hypothetical protein
MNLRAWWLLLLFAPVFAIAPARSADGPAAAGADAAIHVLELSDQFGNPDALVRYRGAPVVAVVVSVRRLSMIERWERDLGERVPGIRFLNIADLPDDAAVDPDRTAATLRKRVPAGVPVLMDLERRWASSFGLDTALPNLLVFDAHGSLLARFRGRWSASLAEEVARAVPRAIPQAELR